MPKIALFLINSLLILFFCFSSVSYAQVKEVSMSEVQTCHYLNMIEGTSDYGKKSNWLAVAKFSALVKAEKMGASHVVWDQIRPIGAFSGVIIAKGYQCS